MKIETMNIPAAGTWARDCELMSLSDEKGFELVYHKDDDDTYWVMRAEGVAAYKVVTEELSRTGYLINLPTDGAFYEVKDSPWIKEFGPHHENIFSVCSHYVLYFY